MQRLSPGVNFSWYERYWESYETIMGKDFQPIIKQIDRAGFNTIRLPVHFDMFLESNNQFKTAFLQKLQSIYQVCAQRKLNLVIVYHYGKINEQNTDAELQRIIGLWKQLLDTFRGIGYDNLIFELYNEPTIDKWVWKYAIEKIVPALRNNDNNRFFIVGASNYNGANELLEMGRLGDDKTIYTFHFYEPYVFTHQGAEWTKEKTYITGYPYPYSARKMHRLKRADAGSLVADEYNRYPREANSEYLLERLTQILTDCKNAGIPVMCTEFGVIKTVPKKSKYNYFTDVTAIFTSLKIPAIVWDWDDRFTINYREGRSIKPIRKWVKRER